MGTAIFVLTMLGCVTFAYAWGISVGYAMGRGRRYLDRRLEELDRETE